MSTRRSGFTLVEVLISLAIFVMAAVVLGAAYLNVLNGYEVANRAVAGDQDVRFARAMLMTEADPDAAAKGAEFDTVEQHHVVWTATLNPTDTTDVFEVEFVCDVTGSDLKQPLHVKQTFRLLRPTWSKDADRNALRQKATDRINKLLGIAPS